MKRLYIAIAFLIIAVSLCTVEQISVEKVCKTSVEYLDNALTQVNDKDYKRAEETCISLDKYWKKQYKFLSAMIDNDQLNGFSVTVNSLGELAKNKNDSLEYEIINAKKQIESIADNQKITFGNVF